MGEKKSKRHTDVLTIHHPATGGEAQVQRRSLPHYVNDDKGWKEGPLPEKKEGGK